MIDKEIEIKSDAGSEFEIIPEDTYQAVIDSVELTEQPMYRKPTEMEEVLAFRFAILSKDKDLNGRLVWKRIKPVVNAGFKNGNASSLYVLLKAALKKEPDMEKIYTTVDINGLLDKQVRLMIEVKKTQKDGREYNKVSTILASKEDMEVSKEILEQRKKMNEKKEEKESEKEEGSGDQSSINVEEIPF